MLRSSVRRVLPLVLFVLAGVCGPIVETATRNPIAARNPRPATGKFLVARREMPDPNFAKSVVLLLNYGAEGALGLVINRPSQVEVSALGPEIDGLEARTDPIYLGGPVAMDSLFVVFRADEPPEDSEPVFEHVHVTRSVEVLQSLAGDEEPREFRVFAGYAGWGPGQLDMEMARGDWHVVDPDEESLFAGDGNEVWESLVPPEPTRQVRLRAPRRGAAIVR